MFLTFCLWDTSLITYSHISRSAQSDLLEQSEVRGSKASRWLSKGGASVSNWLYHLKFIRFGQREPNFVFVFGSRSSILGELEEKFTQKWKVSISSPSRRLKISPQNISGALQCGVQHTKPKKSIKRRPTACSASPETLKTLIDLEKVLFTCTRLQDRARAPTSDF